MSEKNDIEKKQNLFDSKNSVFIFMFIVLAIGFCAYGLLFWNPPNQFWDENYHIASAQKYIDGVMYMEPHPPLGKMFIALGEIMFNTNNKIDRSSFLTTDYISTFPEHYSFLGVRFFSTFFAILSSVVFFGILYQLFKKPLFAFLMTSFYLFDNALIVHSRSAMLEGIQIFFILSAILFFIYIIQKKQIFSIIDYLILGLISGLAISVKANSMILLLLPFFMVVREMYNFYDMDKQKNIALKKYVNYFFKNAGKALVFVGAFLFVFFTIFYIHFSLGTKILNNRNYAASPEYLKIIEKKQTGDPTKFFVMLRDNLTYMKNYQNGVPKLDKTKDDENGSYPIEWTIGGKTINYRWNKYVDNSVSYLYLAGNPIIWLSGLLGVILSFSLIIGRLIFGLEIKNKKIFWYIVAFLFFYVSYMYSVMMIDRVMYMYHYFIPLLVSLILISLVIYYIFETEINNNDRLTYISLGIFCVIIIGTFIFFSPLTYYVPLSTKDFLNRIWFNFWGLKNV
jgi:dolichyl-phosphate-mannose-protein mannosyltransferase